MKHEKGGRGVATDSGETLKNEAENVPYSLKKKINKKQL